jgi:hypothetical protein
MVLRRRGYSPQARDVIVVGRSGCRVDASPADLATLREQFDKTTCARLPGFLAPALLGDLWAMLDKTLFTPFRHDDIGMEEMAESATLNAMLMLALNDPALLAMIEEITGRGPLGLFEGRVYRIRPDAGHFDSWHADTKRNRKVALSINLQRETVVTAPLQIRRADSEEILCEVTNSIPGDAVLFAVDDVHEHRIKPIPEAGVRIACAGWFCPGMDLRMRLEGRDLPSDG